jgi:soluble lytic murein transglycosylase
MMKNKLIHIWAILTLVTAGCTLQLPFILTPTITPIPSSTPTLTPTPTLIPTPTLTPVPSKRVENADYALFLGDYDQAMQLYQDALNASSDPEIQAAALYGIGRIQLLQGNTSQALDTFKKLAEQYASSPDGARSYYFLGQIYTGLERYDDAAAAYAQYLQVRPGMIDSYVQELRGDVLASGGKYQEAIAAYLAAAAAPHLGDNQSMETKEANSKALNGDLPGAIEIYSGIYDSSTNDYTKSQMDDLIGQADLSLGKTQEGYQRFLDAVNNFPSSYYSYESLVTLVNAGVPVDNLNRGLVDYFAAQYDVALQAFDRYLANPSSADAGTAHYYKGLTLRAIGENLSVQNALLEDQQAIAEWQAVIKNYPESNHWVDAWEDIAYTQWAYSGQPALAAQTLLDAVTAAPQIPSAPAELFDAGRYFERADMLQDAAKTWESLADQYPSSTQTSEALIFAGVCDYRLTDFSKAQADFQRSLVSTIDPSAQAEALLWVGKAQKMQNDQAGAQTSWQIAAAKDPTGYYSDRASDLLVGLPPFTSAKDINLTVDLQAEWFEAQTWMRTTFSLSQNVDLSGLGAMASDPRMVRGQELWSLGLYTQASAEFQDLQTEVQSDPANTFRLIQFFIDQGLYRLAILASRQVLTLAGMSDAATLTAPLYFNHVRFGLYYQDQVLAAAQAENLDPLLLFSLIRQESLFDGFIQSSAGAVGLTQLMPATAQEVVTNMGWPDQFAQSDLDRPVINIPLGAHYLVQYQQLLDDNLYAMLAAYNGGPGNASAWLSLAPNEPDLFVEVVRIQETRDYIMQIAENYEIYKQLYSLNH